MKISTLFFILLVLPVVPTSAQFIDSLSMNQEGYETEMHNDETYNTIDPATLNTTKNYSAEKLTVRKFDDASWKKVVGETNYTEESKRVKKKKNSTPQEGSGDGHIGKSNQRTERIDENEDEENGAQTSDSIGWSASWLTFFFYAMIIVIIVAILIIITKNISIRTSPKKTKNELIDVTAPVENIADLDIDMLLQKAAGNYRLAVRLYYLGLLKKLNEVGFIVWKKDKTNRDYLAELYAKVIHYQDIQRLTLAYEQVWYGDHTISAEAYQQLRDDFKAIDRQLTDSIEGEKK